MRKGPLLLILLLAAGWPRGAAARQQPAVLLGRVTSAETAAPLQAANVMLAGTVRGTLTDREGTWRLPGLEPGTYRIRFSVIGYRPEERNVSLRSGQQVRVDVALVSTPLAMPDVVVTAGRTEQQAQEAPAATSLITADQITSRAAPTLETVLPLVTGVTMVDDQVGIRGSTGYNRGAGGRVLVLTDGVPGLGGDTGNVRWDTFPPQVIDRVEVVRGAASSLYGSSAMGGVVNVITRSARGAPVTDLRVRAERPGPPAYDEFRLPEPPRGDLAVDLTRVMPVGSMGLLASAAWADEGGYRENGWSRRAQLYLKLEGARDAGASWHLSALGAREDAGHFIEWKGVNDPYEVTAAARGDWLRSDKVLLTGSWRRLIGPATYLQVQPHLMGVSWKDHFHDSSSSATTVRTAADVQLVTVAGGGTLTAGTALSTTGVKAVIYGEHRVYEGAVYLQQEAALTPRLHVNAGGRIDMQTTDVTKTHALFSPRAALVWTPRPPLGLRISAGRGFRAPSVAETFASTSTTGFRIIPNLDLEPETAWTFEGGGTWRPIPVLQFEGALFDSRYRSMIEPTIVQPTGDIQFRNVTRARLTGAEVSLVASLPSGVLQGGVTYTWVHARDEAGGRPLAYRRPRQGSVQAQARLGAIVLGADWLFGATMDTTAVYPFERRNPLQRLDLRCTVPLPGRMDLTLMVRNSTDYYYTEIERNLSPPRSLVLLLHRGW